MKRIEFAIETNENSTVNLIDQDGNIYLECATIDEIQDYLDDFRRQIFDFQIDL